MLVYESNEGWKAKKWFSEKNIRVPIPLKYSYSIEALPLSWNKSIKIRAFTSCTYFRTIFHLMVWKMSRKKRNTDYSRFLSFFIFILKLSFLAFNHFIRHRRTLTGEVLRLVVLPHSYIIQRFLIGLRDLNTSVSSVFQVFKVLTFRSTLKIISRPISRLHVQYFSSLTHTVCYWILFRSHSRVRLFH